MSSPHPRFPRSFNDLLRTIRDYLIDNVRRALIQAGLQVVQAMYDVAVRRREKYVLLYFLFCLADASLVRKGLSVWRLRTGTAPV
jgi:hypothetical protein